MLVNARLDVNVALNRPSYQVSTYTDPYSPGSYPASYANDGSRGTNVHSGPCSHTNDALNPWWSVDLEVALYVDSIKLTNRDSSRTYTSIRFLPFVVVAWWCSGRASDS